MNTLVIVGLIVSYIPILVTLLLDFLSISVNVVSFEIYHCQHYPWVQRSYQKRDVLLSLSLSFIHMTMEIETFLMHELFFSEEKWF